jgi:hypothetical protein
MRSVPVRVVVYLCLTVAVLAVAFSASSTSAATIPLRVPQAVFTTNPTNVRATADGTLVGTQPRYALGTITAGPVTVPGNSVLWFKVAFNSGPSGWVGADMLIDGVPIPSAVNVGTPGSPASMLLDENGDIEIVYSTGFDSASSDMHVTYSFRESTNQGLSFSPPSPLPVMQTQTFQPFINSPQIASERNGAIDIVYTCAPGVCSPGSSLPTVNLIRSIDHGATFSAPILISVPPDHNPVLPYAGASSPVIAACGAGVTIAWIDDGIGTFRGPFSNPDLYIVNVVNGVPGAPFNVTADSTGKDGPQILVNPQGTVYLGWTSIAVTFSNTSALFTSIPNCAAIAQ